MPNADQRAPLACFYCAASIDRGDERLTYRRETICRGCVTRAGIRPRRPEAGATGHEDEGGYGPAKSIRDRERNAAKRQATVPQVSAPLPTTHVGVPRVR